MSVWKKCPACGGTLTGNDGKCPFCGLTGLNYSFFNKQDYEEWMRQVVKPHQAKLMPHVSAGAGHALILFASGALYGIGSNDAGQLGEPSVVGEILTQPEQIASGVSGAAAGRDYSIIVREGQVELMGTGEYAECFSGLAGTEVYALSQNNVFWIRNAAGKLYAFGDNKLEMVEPRKTEKIHTFPAITATVRYDAEIREFGTEHKKSYVSSTTDAWTVEQGIKDKWTADGAYQNARQCYGGNNLELKLSYSKRKLLSGESLDCPVHTEKREYTGTLFHVNQRIYQPVRSMYAYESAPVFMGSGLRRKTDDEKQGKNRWENAKKVVYSGTGEMFILTEQGDLYYQKNNNKKKLDEHVADMSAALSTIVIAKKSGEILYGTLKEPDQAEAMKALQCFRVMEGHF